MLALLAVLLSFRHDRPQEIASKQLVPVATRVVPISDAQIPDERIFPMIPKPKNDKLDFTNPVVLPNLFVFPVGRVRFWDLFKKAVAQRFVVPAAVKGTKPLSIDGGVHKFNLRPGAYSIDISAKGVTLFGEEDEGLRDAMYRLARLVFAKNGKLYLPSGHLDDEPKTTFRGVHLFVGSEARAFQGRLWERVLSPLGFNRVVLQCERTAWDSVPIDASMHPMPKDQLAALFQDYRKRGVEPIPLIQSFGHMQWFFAGGKRLDLALNPQTPYTIDPDKPGTRTALEALWSEAIKLLQPQTIHFGCDEVDMLGIAHDSARMTQLWQHHVPFLGSIAKKHDVAMMVWGDEALAPSEAPDATNGDDPVNAHLRRSAIPAGSFVADWHYKADPRPELYYPTLQLWKHESLVPIATAWYQPDNVRGVDVAATLEHAGTLQTTWAGYESDELSMVQNLEQFTAFVLAADYSWSGRGDAVPDLGYDAGEVFRMLYAGSPSVLKPAPGEAVVWSQSKPATIGSMGFQVCDPIVLGPGGVSRAQVNVPATASRLFLALDAVQRAKNGQTVAEVEVRMANGKTVHRSLAYGREVRAPDDTRLTLYADRGSGMCAFQVGLPEPGKVSSITISSTGGPAVRLYGITTR